MNHTYNFMAFLEIVHKTFSRKRTNNKSLTQKCRTVILPKCLFKSRTQFSCPFVFLKAVII